ncbi:hypothetical protein RR46_07466 [Papilio xuthus]|uniref:Uncharacterized protein n=1 Tax=Papilio xuthus TaxID=66420 RepID=A0A194PY93_PAPXU|nr:hypothetical protein RR46_07466 [Papilio xuthus]
MPIISCLHNVSTIRQSPERELPRQLAQTGPRTRAKACTWSRPDALEEQRGLVDWLSDVRLIGFSRNPLQTAEVKGRVRSPHFCRTAQQFVEQSAPARAVKGSAILCSRADCVGAIFIAPAI